MAKYSYPVWAIDQITDDKTVVCMMNEQAKVSCQPPAFYSEPDWQGLKTTYEKMVHPEKFVNEQPKKDLGSTQQINADNNAKKQSHNKPKSEDNALSIINRSAKSCIEIFNMCIVLCCILVNAI